MFTSKPPTCTGRTLDLSRKDSNIRYLRHLGNSDIAKKLVLELGGSDALIVLDDACRDPETLDRAVQIAIRGRFGNSGQRCTSSKRILVEDSVKEVFTSRFVECAERLPFGNGEDAVVGPVISDEAAAFLNELVRDAVSEGAALRCGGESKGRLIPPTVLTDVKPTMRIVQEECLGPIAVLLTFFGDNEVVDLVNSSRFGLTAAIVSEDRKRARRIADRLECGGVIINGPTGRWCANTAPPARTADILGVPTPQRTQSSA